MVTRRFEPVRARDVERWDRETDVLVVGFGAAGAAASIEASRRGVDVLIIEKLSGAGGSSAQSGGELYLGGGTSVQRACGFDDSSEAMYAFLERALGPHADVAKLRAYCDGSVEHFDWLVGLGVPFNESLYDRPAWMPATVDGLMWLGENAWPYDTLAKPAPRGHRPAAPLFAGRVLMDVLAAAVVDVGASIAYDTRAIALIVDDDGAVVGVRARHFKETVDVRARGGVVLTTGGFVDNPAMVADHAPALVGHGNVSDGGDDGSGIQLALAHGAATRRMAAVEVALTVVPAMTCRGILVNARGERFINEDVYPGHISHAALLTQPAPWWVILDESGFESMPVEDTWGLQPQYAAETAGELERELGMPTGALEHTIAVYSRDAESGEDRQFHKHSRWLRRLEPPYAAFSPAAASVSAGGSSSGISGFTLGGLKTNLDGQVLHVSGEIIDGLYAAGRASSGIHGDNYVSGTSLGDGTFFGRRAGQAAATPSGRSSRTDSAS